MVSIRSLGKRLIWLAVTLSAASCGSNESTPPTTSGVVDTNQEETVVILSTWGDPGTAQNLQSVVDIYKRKHPNGQVINDPVPVMGVAGVLAQRIAAGKTPDLYVQHSSDLAGFIQTNGAASLLPLDEFLALPSQADVMSNLYPEIAADVTINGTIYGMPAGYVARVNSLFYNKHVFAENQLSVPTSVDELLTVCQKLKAVGVTPITQTFASLLFEAVLSGALGIDNYYSYRRGGSLDAAAIQQGIDVFADVVEKCIDPTTLRPIDGTQDVEVNALMTNKVAMFITGEWTNPMLKELGWTPGVDYGIVAPPGSSGLVAYAADVYTIPAGAPNPQGAMRFLEAATSAEGQLAFTGGDSTPVRMDVELKQPNSERRVLVEEWKNAKHRLLSNTSMSLEGPLRGFILATPRDKEALLGALMSPR